MPWICALTAPVRSQRTEALPAQAIAPSSNHSTQYLYMALLGG